MRSAVLSVELSDESVLRRVFAVARRVVVWVRRSVILLSRSASCSVVHASAAFCHQMLDEWGNMGLRRREVYLESVVDDLLAWSI